MYKDVTYRCTRLYSRPSLRSGELETDLHAGGGLPGPTTQRLGSPVCSSAIRRARMALGHKQKQLLRGSKRVHFLLALRAVLGWMHGNSANRPTPFHFPFPNPPPFLPYTRGDPKALPPVGVASPLLPSSESVPMGTPGDSRRGWPGQGCVGKQLTKR